MRTSAGIFFRRAALLYSSLLLIIAGCSEIKRTSENDFNPVCMASWYGADFHGKRTSSGDLFDMRKKTAAHKTLPFGTILLVTNVENGRSTRVVINDRGPLAGNIEIDLSYSAAKEIGLIVKGTGKVRLEYIGLDSSYKKRD